MSFHKGLFIVGKIQEIFLFYSNQKLDMNIGNRIFIRLTRWKVSEY